MSRNTDFDDEYEEYYEDSDDFYDDLYEDVYDNHAHQVVAQNDVFDQGFNTRNFSEASSSAAFDERYDRYLHTGEFAEDYEDQDDFYDDQDERSTRPIVLQYDGLESLIAQLHALSETLNRENNKREREWNRGMRKIEANFNKKFKKE